MNPPQASSLLLPGESSPAELVATGAGTARAGSAVAEFFRRHRWWITRTLALPLHVALFATAAFFLVRLVPGDPVAATLDASAGLTQADYDRARAAMGLDGSIWHQLGRFWSQAVHLDLGESIVRGRPVTTEIWERLPSTLELVLVGLFGVAVLSLVLGLVVLKVRNRVVQRIVRGYAGMSGTVPAFAAAIIGIVVFCLVLRWLPAPLGRTGAGLQVPLVTGFPLLDSVLTGEWDVLFQIALHYVLPIGVMVFCYTPNILNQLVLGLDESASSAATLFRIASGASRPAVYLSIFRRAVASSIVMFGTLLGGLIGGIVVIEQLFSLGGIGQLAVDAVDTTDFPMLQGFLIVVAAICLVIFFLVDIVNMLLDPRRRPGVAVKD